MGRFLTPSCLGGAREAKSLERERSDRTEVRPNAEHGKRPLVVHWPRAILQLNSGAIFLANLTEGRSDAPDSFPKAPRLEFVLCMRDAVSYTHLTLPTILRV